MRLQRFSLLLALLCSSCCGRVLPPETSIFSSPDYPKDTRLYPTVGNGYVGLSVLLDTMYIGGVFNGPIALNTSTNDVSHRARIPATNSFSLGLPVPFERSLELDVNDASYQEQFTFPQSQARLNHTIYAHREHRNLLVTTLVIDNTRNSDTFSFTYSNNQGKPSSDINFTATSCPYEAQPSLACVSGWTQVGEFTSSLTQVALVHFAALEGTINTPAGARETLYFPTVLMTSLEATSNSSDLVDAAVQLWESLWPSRDAWLSQHVSAWEALWADGRIDVVGNDTVARSVYSSLYYIMNSVRADWPYGLSPGSLSSNAYNGHTFWDQESWMYPPLLMLQQALAASCLEYRTARLLGAQLNANTSLQRDVVSGSARYPWESGFIGMELCPPKGNPEGAFEIHINADIALAMRQYWYMTRDADWLSSVYHILTGICQFWVDWSEYDAGSQRYEFRDVQGPDEV